MTKNKKQRDEKERADLIRRSKKYRKEIRKIENKLYCPKCKSKLTVDGFTLSIVDKKRTAETIKEGCNGRM